MLAFFIIFGAVVLDQFTKFLIRLFMNVGDSVTLIPSVMNITYVENDGAA
ncbi:MAG: signal peptidase II, partial [Clostridia bacterium]|nr:signal peptidase II [Clostridia bacterium]